MTMPEHSTACLSDSTLPGFGLTLSTPNTTHPLLFIIIAAAALGALHSWSSALPLEVTNAKSDKVHLI